MRSPAKYKNYNKLKSPKLNISHNEVSTSFKKHSNIHTPVTQRSALSKYKDTETTLSRNNRNMDSYALKSLRDLKSKYVIDILQSMNVSTRANPNESKKSATFVDNSDADSVVENDCDNDYSDMIEGMNRLR